MQFKRTRMLNDKTEIVYRDRCLALYVCIMKFLVKNLNFNTFSFSRLPYTLRILVHLQLDFYHSRTIRTLLILTLVVLVLMPLRLDRSILLMAAMQSSHPSCSLPRSMCIPSRRTGEEGSSTAGSRGQSRRAAVTTSVSAHARYGVRSRRTGLKGGSVSAARRCCRSSYPSRRLLFAAGIIPGFN
jgi:hypothetical protein